MELPGSDELGLPIYQVLPPWAHAIEGRTWSSMHAAPQ